MAGRPRVYETVEELEQAIEDYINPNGSPRLKPTITGLAYHLGFESRQSIYDYEKEGAFSYTIKRARLFIESVYEEKLHEAACTGGIFALKNFGWKDKQDIEHTGNVGHTIVYKEQAGNDPIAE